MPYEESGTSLQDMLFQFHSGYDCNVFIARMRKHNFMSATEFIKYIINDKDQLREEKKYIIKQIPKMETDNDYMYMALAYQICTKIANGDYS